MDSIGKIRNPGLLLPLIATALAVALLILCAVPFADAVDGDDDDDPSMVNQCLNFKRLKIRIY